MKRNGSVGVLALGALLLGACASTQVPPYGIREGRLPPCADTRTCLSSHPEESEEARLDPLEYEGTRRHGRRALAAVVQGFPGARIVSSHRNYLRVEFAGHVTRDEEEFYFKSDAVIDEVEFYFPPYEQRVEVRAAARSGLMDHDSVRSRFDALQELLENYQNERGVGGLRI